MNASFFVAGLPKGQPRAKACIRGKHAGVYDPGTADGWKLLVRAEANKYAPEMPCLGPVKVALFFSFKRPGAHYKTVKGQIQLKELAPWQHTTKPDADNLAKAVMDAITNLGTYWRDDAQGSSLEVKKQYGEMPGCTVFIREIREEP